jgi:hypothetical protein
MNPIYIITILLKNLSHNNSLNLHNNNSPLIYIIMILLIPPHEERALSFIHESFEKEDKHLIITDPLFSQPISHYYKI